MKRLLLSCAALCALTGAAAAADPAYEADTGWGGFYLGSYLGGIGFEFDGDAAPGGVDIDGAIAGGLFGYNFAFGNWVLGVEGDIGFSNANTDDQVALTTIERAGVDWVGTGRGRVGYAFDNILIFGAAGVAGAELELDDDSDIDETTLWGWTAGAGVEIAISPDTSVRFEYLYSDYGDGTSVVDGDTYDVELTSHQARVALNSRFESVSDLFDFGGDSAGPDSWTGFYIGAHSGWAFAEGFHESAFPGSDGDFDFDGALRGFQAGYNWQAGNFVFGLEIDGALSRAEETDVDALDLERIGLDWLATGRARLGYAFGDFLIFGTGGGAYGVYELYDNTDSRDFESAGWTAGGGIEYRLTDSTSIKLDYLHVELDDEGPREVSGDDRTISDLELDVVRVGANYRF